MVLQRIRHDWMSNTHTHTYTHTHTKHIHPFYHPYTQTQNIKHILTPTHRRRSGKMVASIWFYSSLFLTLICPFQNRVVLTLQKALRVGWRLLDITGEERAAFYAVPAESCSQNTAFLDPDDWGVAESSLLKRMSKWEEIGCRADRMTACLLL